MGSDQQLSVAHRDALQMKLSCNRQQMQLSHLRQRLTSLGAKPCRADRLLPIEQVSNG
jgi:hypothetical protein